LNPLKAGKIYSLNKFWEDHDKHLVIKDAQMVA